MEIILQFLLILFLAKVFGEAIERVGLPDVLGEISAGMFLGALLLFDPNSETLSFFAELGAIFLLFTAGYKEVHLNELKSASRKALIPTISQILAAFFFGFLIGRMFDFGFLESLFMGVAFSPTGIGVTVKTLIDLDYLSTKTGSLILSSAILDDIIGIFMLSIVTTIATFNQLPSGVQFLSIAGKMVLFVIIMGLLGRYVFPFIFKYIQMMRAKESIFAFVVMTALFSAYLSEVFGMHAVIGAFIGGALLSDIPFAKIEDVQSKVSGMTYGILVPFFFAFIGLSIDIGALKIAGLFTLLVIMMAFAGKLIGGFVGSRIIGMDFHDSLIFGIGMIPRAGVELVVISVGKSAGVLSDEAFSAIVVMVVASIIVSPLLLKSAIGLREKSKATDA